MHGWIGARTLPKIGDRTNVLGNASLMLKEAWVEQRRNSDPAFGREHGN